MLIAVSCLSPVMTHTYAAGACSTTQVDMGPTVPRGMRAVVARKGSSMHASSCLSCCNSMYSHLDARLQQALDCCRHTVLHVLQAYVAQPQEIYQQPHMEQPECMESLS